MADNITLNAGSGGSVLATDDVSGVHYQIVKLAVGALDAVTLVSDADPLPIDDAGGSITVDGTVTANAGTGPWPVTDNGGALTIDHATLDNAHSADFDTGAGTDTTPAFGIAVPASGGAAVVPGDATAGLKVDLGADNDVTVSSSALPSGAATAANQSTIIGHVDGIEGLLTDVEANTDFGAVTGGGVEAGSLRVTIANDSTGVLSVDDNGGALSVDDNGGSLTIDHITLDDAHSADFDTGAGTDTTPAFGIAVPASGGAAVVPGDATAGLKVDLGADNDVVVSGTVTADAGTGPWPVTDNGGALTVDHATLDNAHNADFDTGAGTDTTPAYGIAVPASGGAAVVPGDATAGLKVDLGADNDVVVSGTVNVGTMPATAGEGAALPSTFVVVAGDDGTDTHPLQLDGSGHLQVDIAADSVGIGGGTQYTEDDAAAANPVGTQPVLVRQDTPASEVSANGDVIAQRATQYGAAYVQIVDSSGNFINSFGGSGGTSHADDAAFTIGGAASITPVGYLADETTPDSVDEGDVGVARMTLNRKAYAVLSDPTAERSAAVDASNRLSVAIDNNPVLGAGTNNIGDVDIASALPAGDNNIGNVDVVTLPSIPAGTNNIGDVDIASALPAGDNNIGNVDVVTLPSLPAGTNNIGDVDIASALPAGDNNIGNVDVVTLPSLPAGTNIIGDVGLSGARTSGGSTPYRNVDVDETEDEIKSSAGQLYWLHAMNLTASVLYLHLYNATAASVTVGTTTPTLTFALPTQGDTNGAGFALSVPNGIAFGTAITIACTTTIGGTAGPAANGCIVNLGYA